MTIETIESGHHILLDINGVESSLLWDEDFIRSSMLDAIKATGANVLHHYFHHFGEQYGVTGIVAVSESHTSIHTWPEWNYASIDVFLCRGMNPQLAVDHLIKCFGSTNYTCQNIRRFANVQHVTEAEDEVEGC